MTYQVMNRFFLSVVFLLGSGITVSAQQWTMASGSADFQKRSGKIPSITTPLGSAGFDYITGAGGSLTNNTRIFPDMQETASAPDMVYEITAVSYRTPPNHRVRVTEVYVVYNRNFDQINFNLIEGWQFDVYSSEDSFKNNPIEGDEYTESYTVPTLGNPSIVESISLRRGNNYKYGFPVNNLILSNNHTYYLAIRPSNDSQINGNGDGIGGVAESISAASNVHGLYVFDATQIGGIKGFFDTTSMGITPNSIPAYKMVGKLCALTGPC